MNTTWNWRNLKEVAILVVGVLLIFGLFVLKQQVTDLNHQVIGLNRDIEANKQASNGGRSLLCLQLKAQGQPVEKYTPCMKPDVYILWKDQPIATLSQRLCATGTKTEGCEDPNGP
jgi:hypothetical protein